MSLNSFLVLGQLSKGFLPKIAKVENQLMQYIITLLKYYVMLFLLNYKLS